MFPLEATGKIITIPVESEDGGFLEVFQYVRSPQVPPVMRERIVLTVKGPRGGNRYILWLTREEVHKLCNALEDILEQDEEVTYA